MTDEYNIVVTGVGGQGTILASNVIADAAIKTGLEARIGQTFTAAQRGGSVSAHIRIGKKIYSPLISKGHANVLMGFEPLEAIRQGKYLSKNGTLIINVGPIPLVSTMLSLEHYPEISQIIEHFEKRIDRVIKVNATKIASSIGTPRITNSVMLGILSGLEDFPVPHEKIVKSIKENIPKAALTINLKAFNAGKKIIAKIKKDHQKQRTNV